ncbi:hypothetical protein DND132_2460 [Pseudodesulfovibrio mercurii]|uniref:Uncharacterized protein n=1 Tax=Pseudodesulfovibrio mercurii TaxID=641491 RepID=F0JCI3_9BACT|nr:hypothetical protein [Pseudodesulfovibrio mercurii]EGB15663.1 hypothetical protein DND132_2460 [Pseudodesulfovibrio mercurii]
MTAPELRLDRLPDLSEPRRSYLADEWGITDIAMLTVVASDDRYGRSGLIKGLGMSELDFATMLGRAIGILREECWSCLLLLDGGWRPFTDHPDAPPIPANGQDDGPPATPGERNR